MKLEFSLVLVAFAAISQAKYLGIYFGGQYQGSCYEGYDGYYYNDLTSFVQCTGGQAYVMQCAPGTANKPMSTYKTGYYYASYTIFCDQFYKEVEQEGDVEEQEEVQVEADSESDNDMTDANQEEEGGDMEIAGQEQEPVESDQAPAEESEDAASESTDDNQDGEEEQEGQDQGDQAGEGEEQVEEVKEDAPEEPEEPIEEEAAMEKEPDQGMPMPPFFGYWPYAPRVYPGHFYHAYPYFGYPAKFPYDNPYFLPPQKSNDD